MALHRRADLSRITLVLMEPRSGDPTLTTLGEVWRWCNSLTRTLEPLGWSWTEGRERWRNYCVQGSATIALKAVVQRAGRPDADYR